MSYRRQDQYEFSAKAAFYSLIGATIIIILSALWNLL